jgi:hypothetical protein
MMVPCALDHRYLRGVFSHFGHSRQNVQISNLSLKEGDLKPQGHAPAGVCPLQQDPIVFFTVEGTEVGVPEAMVVSLCWVWLQDHSLNNPYGLSSQRQSVDRGSVDRIENMSF